MTVKVFIDDIRNPPSDDYLVMRSYAETVGYIRQNGCPEFISFDHDLGSNDGLDGIDIAKWLVEKDMNSKGEFIPKNFKFAVHSANIIGAENIEGLLSGYLDVREDLLT